MKTTSEFETVKKNETVKKASLNGLVLIWTIITTIFEMKYELHPQTHKPYKLVSKNKVDQKIREIQFPLKKVSVKELAEYRKKEIPSFVLKTEDGLYYTKIHKEISLISSKLFEEEHKCGSCNRLSDADCQKVRERSTGIERYPWIPRGYETFATKCDCFYVAECLHWQKFPQRKNPTIKSLTEARLYLAQYMYPEVRSSADVKAIIEANQKKEMEANSKK